MQGAYENENEEQQHHIDFTLAQKTAVFVPAALAACGLDALLQAPLPLAVGGVVGAFILAKKSPQIYENLRKYLPASQQTPDPQPGQTVEMVEGEWTLMDRLLGRHLDENGNPLPPPLRAHPKEATKDEDQAQPDDSAQSSEPPGMDVTPPLVTACAADIPPQFTLKGESLAAIKDVNSKRFVYFGKSLNHQVLLHIDEMYHVLDVAKSGRGKSNRFRNGMMQVVTLADTYYINPFAAPVKPVTDARKVEVWQPIFDRLANKHPVREDQEIMQLLTWLVSEIERRNELEQRRDFSWRARPVFVFIDEIPEIYARCPDAVRSLDRIGRGGRQFGIFAWVATQSALVSDIGLSTASQAQFKTLIYGGGDKTSANRVMGSVTHEQEKALKSNGAGLTLMVADGVDDTEYVRAPLITNEALFAYFGLPFRLNDWLAPEDLSPSTLSRPAGNQAQNASVVPVKARESERRESVKAPNRDAILDALSALQDEGKPLTLNAIVSKSGLTWRHAEEIEEVAAWAGFELERGKGRPAKEG